MRRGVALGVFVVAIAALVGCSAWLFAVDRSAAVPDNDFFVASAAGALADAIVGAIILARHPRHRIGWILTVSAAVDAIGTLVGEYGPYALTIGRPAPARRRRPVARFVAVGVRGWASPAHLLLPPRREAPLAPLAAAAVRARGRDQRRVVEVDELESDCA